jgi:dTDP-4-amino-4,6-dideoxygalactose transaminase
MWGINTRLDNLQAAILLAKFKHYRKTMQRRRKIAQRYCERLSKIPEITLPPAPNDADTRHYDVYQNFEIEAENRDDLWNYLEMNGIGTLIQWGGRALQQASSEDGGALRQGSLWRLL